MVRKEFKFEEITVDNELPATEEANIEHINSLISSSEKSEDADAVTYEKSPIAEDPKPEKNEEKPATERKIPKDKIRTGSVSAERHDNKKKPMPNSHNSRKPEHNTKRKTSEKNMERIKMKEHKKAHKNDKPKKKSGLTWIWILLAVIVVAAVAFLLIKSINLKPVNPVTSEIAAAVNGEPIYLKSIDDQYNNMNPLMQSIYSREVILNQTIDEMLLLQEAKNQGIKATQDQVGAEITNIKEQNKLSDKDFEDILGKQNVTLKQLEEIIQKRLMIKELLNRTIFNDIKITEQDINAYYEQNKEQFAKPEQVKAAHILIMIKENVTDEDAYKKILEINKSLTSSNFCELVTKYTEDPGSKDTCGTYTFSKGEMVTEFEEAAFSLEDDETTIVKTIYGYHLIKRLEYMSASTPKLSEVSKDIEQTLRDKGAESNFNNLIATLRSKAVIVNYMIKGSNTVNIDELKDNSSETPTGNTASNNLDSFAKCLTEKGVKMYGASWCPHCENNKRLFGNSWNYVNYVECAVEDQPQVQTQACSDAGISGYPTWLINNEKYPGEQSLERLAQLSGCKI